MRWKIWGLCVPNVKDSKSVLCVVSIVVMVIYVCIETKSSQIELTIETFICYWTLCPAFDEVWTPGRSHFMRLHNNYNFSIQLYEIMFWHWQNFHIKASLQHSSLTWNVNLKFKLKREIVKNLQLCIIIFKKLEHKQEMFIQLFNIL